MEYKKQYNTNWWKFKFRFFLKKLEAICLFIPTITDSKDYNAIAKEIYAIFIKKQQISFLDVVVFN